MNQRRGPTSRRGLRRWWRYAALPLVALALGPFGCQSSAGSAKDQPRFPSSALTAFGKGGGGRAAGLVPAGINPAARSSLPNTLNDTPSANDTPEQGACAPNAAFLPAVPPPVADYPIDLETALGLASAENPTIALAREAVRASQAEQLQARALLLPTLHAGMDVNLHGGNLESAQGIVRNVNRESLTVGAGAAAVGAGTVTIPGVYLFSHLADAIYEPHVARQRVAARRFDAAATDHAVLLDVTTRYFDLVGAEAWLRDVRQSEKELGEVVTLLTDFAQTGQGRQGDADRAASEAELMHAEELRAQEEVAVAAAELARLLDMDPAFRLWGGGPIPFVELVSPERPLPELIQIALGNRPELGAASAEVALRETRLRQEKARPLLPLLSVGFSADGFGGSSNQSTSRLGDLAGRTDFDVYAVWSLENLGLGNRAVQRQRRAAVGEALAERVRVEDVVRREVAEAVAQSAAARRDLDAAAHQLRTAEQGFRLDLERARNIVKDSHPIELLNSVSLLTAARREHIRALIGFDQAQFRLFVALGSPPTAALGDPALPK